LGRMHCQPSSTKLVKTASSLPIDRPDIAQWPFLGMMTRSVGAACTCEDPHFRGRPGRPSGKGDSRLHILLFRLPFCFIPGTRMDEEPSPKASWWVMTAGCKHDLQRADPDLNSGPGYNPDAIYKPNHNVFFCLSLLLILIASSWCTTNLPGSERLQSPSA
jgi:hypothetical protein